MNKQPLKSPLCVHKLDLNSVAREKVLKEIIKAISKRRTIDLKDDMLLRLAHYLERKLFTSAQNLQAYSNIYTIDERIKEASTALAYRLSASKKKSLSGNIERRKKRTELFVGWKCGGCL